MTTFSRLRELDKNAVGAPWHLEMGAYGDADRVYGIYTGKYRHDRIVETDTGVYPPRKPEAQLIVEMRNALPKIFEVLDLYEEALKEICAGTGRDFTMSRYVSKKDLENDKGISLDDAHSAAAKALKRAKEISGE